MKTDLTYAERESLLRQLRIAVALQIQLWDASLAIAEQLECELEEVAKEVQAASITADTGFELDGLAVDEFVGALPPHQLDDGLIKRLENVH
jgi:hypothetical protein